MKKLVEEVKNLSRRIHIISFMVALVPVLIIINFTAYTHTYYFLGVLVFSYFMGYSAAKTIYIESDKMLLKELKKESEEDASRDIHG